MPPKGAATKDKDIAPVEEDVIQAVILAESFNKGFKPLTIDRPRASGINTVFPLAAPSNLYGC